MVLIYVTSWSEIGFRGSCLLKQWLGFIGHVAEWCWGIFIYKSWKLGMQPVCTRECHAQLNPFGMARGADDNSMELLIIISST
jgi:hypothetical protein